MNKRIKKKRMKLDDRRIGDHSYSAKYITTRFKIQILILVIRPIYDRNNLKIRRPVVKSLMNTLYKKWHNYHVRFYEHNPYLTRIKKEYIYDKNGLVKGGEKMRYNSSTFYSFKRQPLPEGYFKPNSEDTEYEWDSNRNEWRPLDEIIKEENNDELQGKD